MPEATKVVLLNADNTAVSATHPLPVVVESGGGTEDVNIAQVAGATVATGHGTAAGTLRVELPTDGTGVVGLNAGTAAIGSVIPNQGTWTDRSGTVATGAASQTLAASNAARKRLLIENPPSATENLFFNFTSAASTTAAGSFVLVPGGSYDSESGPVSTELVAVTAATTGHAFVAKEM